MYIEKTLSILLSVFFNLIYHSTKKKLKVHSASRERAKPRAVWTWLIFCVVSRAVKLHIHYTILLFSSCSSKQFLSVNKKIFSVSKCKSHRSNYVNVCVFCNFISIFIYFFYNFRDTYNKNLPVFISTCIQFWFAL